MANWTIDFATKNGDRIHITIPGASGADVALTPAENPLWIQEEGEEDLFLPVRTQSGYINIISDIMDLAKRIIPLSGGSRKVTVSRSVGGTGAYNVEWVGYVQPKMLSMKIWNGKTQIAIPIECPLSALKYRKFTSSTYKMSIARILYGLTTDFATCLFQSTYIGTMGSTDYTNYSWLAKKVYPALFTGKEYTRLDVLKSICTVFGWTARSMGQKLYFLNFRNVDSRSIQVLSEINQSQLNSVSSGATNREWSEMLLPATAFADNKSELKFIEGINGSTVICNIETWDTSIELPDDDIKTKINNGTIASTQMAHDAGVTYDYFYTDFGTQQTITIGSGDKEWTIEGRNTKVTLDKQDSNDIADWIYTFNVIKTVWADGYTEGTPSTSPEYYVSSWYHGLLELNRTQQSTFNVNGKLNISFGVPQGASKNISFKLRIGSMYYNPATGAWDSTGGICWTTDSKFTANVPANTTGAIGLEIQSESAFTSINISFESIDEIDINSNISEVTHTASSGVNFSKNKNMETDICLKETYIRNCQNLLLNDDETDCTGIYDVISQDAEPFNPLQRLADDMAWEGGKVGMMLTQKVRESLMPAAITPLSIIISEELDADMYPMAIRRDWRYDELTLTLIKRTHQEGYWT